MTTFKELFSVETIDCIVSIALVNRVLWILTGKQNLYRGCLEKQPRELELVDSACRVFKVHGDFLVHDKDESVWFVRLATWRLSQLDDSQNPLLRFINCVL